MSQKHILIIDDEALIRHVLAEYLSECGYGVATAGDGVEGLAIARAQHFDAVLVDLQMPRLNGLEVVATLKAEQPELPVVVVSGTGVLQDVIEAMRRGAWDYITKPVHDIEEIAVIVNRVLEKAHLIAERNRYQKEIEQLNQWLEATVTRQTEDLRFQNRELTALNRIVSAADTTLDPLEILRVLCTELALALNLSHVTAILIEPGQTDTAIVAEYRQADRPPALGERVNLTLPALAWVLQRQASLLVEDVPAASQLGDWGTVLGARGTVTLLLVPVVVRGRVMSIIGLEATSKRLYSDKDMTLIMSTAAAAGQALEALVLHHELQAHAEMLELTVAQRTAELSVALEKARAADEAKSQFLSSVSHELRTPLTSVLLYLELLARGKPENQRRYLDTITREVERLQVLIENLLDLSRLDLGKTVPQLQTVDLNHLLTTLFVDRERLFAQGGLKLQLETAADLPTISADPKLLEQVATNLLSNALNYTPAGGYVWLSTAYIVQDNLAWVTFTVRDTGPGIAPEEQQRLFERFFRGSAARTSKASGTGLGLAISQSIVELHHGKITLDSAVGQGSAFTVWLPCNRDLI